MKKSLLATILILGLMSTSSAFAASVGNVNVNLPKKSTTTAKTGNAAKVQSQINVINNKLNSVSATYEQTVNDLVGNLAAPKEFAAYKAKIKGIKVSSSKTLKSSPAVGTLSRPRISAGSPGSTPL